MRKTISNCGNENKCSLEMTFTFCPRNCRKNRRPISGDPHGTPESGTVPRISRLMALAIRFDGLIGRGEIKDYADLARLGHVSRARITQIMNLLNLSPDIQESILFLPKTKKGRDPMWEKKLRAITAEPYWQKQREMLAHCGVEKI